MDHEFHIAFNSDTLQTLSKDLDKLSQSIYGDTLTTTMGSKEGHNLHVTFHLIEDKRSNPIKLH